MNDAVLTNLAIVGRWYPSNGTPGHPADDGLTVRAGRVLSGYRSDRHPADVDREGVA